MGRADNHTVTATTSDSADSLPVDAVGLGNLAGHALGTAHLEERLRFEALLAEVTARFANLPGEEVDAAIEDVQRRMCESLGLDRSTLFQFSTDDSGLLLTHLHQPSDGPAARKCAIPGTTLPVYWFKGENSQWVPFEVRTLFPWTFAEIRAGRRVILSTPDDLPADASTDKASYARFGTRSTAILPLIVGGRCIGCLTFATMRQVRNWPEDVLARLRFLADVFAGALARSHAETALRRSEERFRSITTNLPGAVYQFYARDTGERGLYYVDAQVEKICGVPAAPLDTFFERFAACIPPEDQERFRASIEDAVESVAPWQYEGRFIKPTGGEMHVYGFSQLRRIGTEVIASGMIRDITERVQARQALSESRATLDTIINSTADLIWSVDPDAFGILTCNQSLRDYFLGGRGIRLEPGMRPEDLFDDQRYVDLWRHFYQRALAEGSFSTEYTTYNGQHILQLNLNLLRRDGQVFGISVFGKDITERKRAEEALRHRNHYIETVLEQSPIGFAASKLDDGSRVFVTGRFEEIYGVPLGSITSLADFFDKVWPDDPAFREQLRARVNADIASGDPGRMCWQNVPVPQPSGQTRYITASNFLLPEQNLMVSTVQDVTERVRAENDVRENEQRFRQVAENVADFIWEVDAKGLYKYTSPSVERILGYTPEELVGKRHFYDLFAPDVRDELKAAAFAVFAARESFRDFPNASISKHGKRVHLETSGSPILDEAGKLIGYRGADSDVTRRLEAEAELRRSLEEVKRLQEMLSHENVYLRKEVQVLQRQSSIVGTSAALQKAMRQAEQVATTDASVLILGETGTGKELLAKYIYSLSGRAGKPFITTNVAAIPSTLLESELFGREKGAYTGALTKQPGRFELAHGGTLFLDEVGEMPPETQAKLLRVLQSGEFERLGSSRTQKVDVRVIAATNRPLSELAGSGSFRRDLFYRLSVFPITLPPLRERVGDIPLLVWAFVQELAEKMGRSIEGLRKADLEALQRYSWPGNVRELRNVVERSMILSRGPELRLALPEMHPEAGEASGLLKHVEKEHIQRVLQSTGHRIYGPGGAAQILGMKPSTLYSLMSRLGIKRQRGDGEPQR